MPPATLGPYRIVGPLGSGGMGEVLLAEDTKLGRRVALKVLPQAMADDPERRGRFEREARAVAALNHPNIITIYAVDEQDGIPFLAMELIVGKTLNDVIPRQGMTLDQLLQVGIPLADAVGAAHQRGITHRDLKPANVMITDEGRVKVLDFGLAKLREESPFDGLTATIAAAPVTGDGRIVGTVAYMSPEQAQGKPVDARSDVFSLGILLFEMATGERPFKGDTNVSVMSAILKDTPASVTDLRQDLPRDIGRILRRCLAKDPDDRYQTAKDLRNDLRLLREDLDSGVAMDARPSSQISQAAVVARPVPLLARSPARVALAAVAVLAIAAGVWYAWRPAAAGTPAFVSITMRRLTNTGTARNAAISPDGRYVVHEDGNFDKPGLWVRQVSTASNVQIVPPTEGTYWGVAFSPDSEAVFYVFSPKNGVVASLFQIPVLGGPPRKVLEDINTPPAFSPDGTRMAFTRGPADGTDLVVLADTDGSNQRRLASRASSDGYTHTRVAWSPDGTLIAAFVGGIPRQRSRIVLIDVETGKEQEFSSARFDYGGQLVWLGDSSALVFDAVEQAVGRWNTNSHLWSLAYPSGTLRRITTDVASYQGVTATAGGRTLVAVQDETLAGLWMAPGGDSARARPISGTNGRAGTGGIDWTPDGRIVYGGGSQGSADIWIANADGSQPRQLTSHPGLEAGPQLRADGTGIIYQSRASGAADVEIWSIDLDGGNPRQIDTGGSIYRGYQQTVGEHVYFKALEKGRPVAYRVPLAGGPRTPLFPDPSRLPPRFDLRSVSPDERWALGRYVAPPIAGIAIVPLDGVGPVRTFPQSYTALVGMGCTWAPDGRAFEDLVFRDGATNLWRFPLDGSPPRAVTTFTSEQILAYRWSRDGETLAMSRGTHSADVVLIASDDKKE